MARNNITNAYVSSSIGVLQCDYLAYMDFSGSAPVRVWTGLETKQFTDFSGSANYIAVGAYGGISAVAETTEVSAKGIELVLSGVDSNYVSLALQNNYRGRTVAVYIIVWDSTHTNYQQSMIFRGRMDQMVITENETSSTINLKCESRLIDLNRPRERRYTDEFQKSLYPNDTGLEFMASMADKSVYWGNTAPVSAVNETGGGNGDETYQQQ